MKFQTNKEKGNAGLAMAIAYFSTNGYTVSIPLNDTQDYDLVIEMDGNLSSVQVKASECLTKNNKYQVALKSCGGTKGVTYKTLVNTRVDFLFVLLADKTMYLIPTNEIKNIATINIGEKYNKYKVEI